MTDPTDIPGVEDLEIDNAEIPIISWTPIDPIGECTILYIITIQGDIDDEISTADDSYTVTNACFSFIANVRPLIGTNTGTASSVTYSNGTYRYLSVNFNLCLQVHFSV